MSSVLSILEKEAKKDPWIADILNAFDMICVAEGCETLANFKFPPDTFFEVASSEMEMHLERSKKLRFREDKEMSYNNAIRNSAIMLFRMRK